MLTTEAPPTGPFSGINLYGLLGLAVFYLLILVIGIWAGRKSYRKKEMDSKEVFVAGRSIGYILGSITLTATWVGGGFINGTSEIIATPGYGLVWTQAPVCYAISLMLGGIFFAKKMRAAGYITMLDPLSERFGTRMGGLLFLPALMAETFWTAAVLSALGSSLQLILNLDSTVSIIVSACIAVFYTVLGGLYSVAYTDVIQLVLIPVGLWLCFPFALRHPAVSDISSTMFDTSNSTGWLGVYDVTWSGNYWDAALLMIFGGIPWQAYFQRVLGCKTPQVARVISVIAGLGCLVMSVPAALIGVVAASTNWNETAYDGVLTDYKLVLPMVMQYLTPDWVGFIGLGAVSAAVMSSADSSILSVSSLFSRNVWKLVFRPKASEREVIWVMRVSVIFVGALAAGIGIVVNSVYLLFYLCSDLVYVVLFPQLTMVLYNKTTNTYGSLSAYIVGLTLRLLGGEALLGLPAVIIFPHYDTASSTQLFPFKTLAMLISFFVLIVVSYGTKALFMSGKLSLKYDVLRCYSGDDKPMQFRDDAMPMKSDLKYMTQDKIMKGPVY